MHAYYLDAPDNPLGAEHLQAEGILYWQLPTDPDAVAHELFAVLRELDAWLAQQGGGEIWVEEPPAGPQWEGVRDRLSRAAA